jgi:5-methylcytosine-specific restriction endonuclease McrA
MERRRRRDVRMAGTYTRVNLEGNKVCVYCGSKYGATWDHVYPVSSAATLRDLGIEVDQRLKIMVRACRQCNSIAGSNLFKSFDRKRAYIRDRLRHRYGYTRLGNAPELPFIAKAVIAEQEDDRAA